MNIRLTLLATIALIVGGCTLGPNYHPAATGTRCGSPVGISVGVGRDGGRAAR